jgi:hypothetical protein
VFSGRVETIFGGREVETIFGAGLFVSSEQCQELWALTKKVKNKRKKKNIICY